MRRARATKDRFRTLGIATVMSALTSCVAVGTTVPRVRPGTVEMVDVTGQSTAQAEGEIRAHGLQGSISVVDNYVCHDPKVQEGFVCTTAPIAGKPASAHTPITLYVRPKETASFVMPDLRGKTGEEAKAILTGLGERSDRVHVEEMAGWQDECQPSRVCRQSPEPGRTTHVTTPAWLQLAPAQRPGRPVIPPPVRAPTDAERKPDTKPEEKPPEPIF